MIIKKVIKIVVKIVALVLLYLTLVPLLFIFGVFCRFTRKPKLPPRLLWGFRPIINNKYFSQALSKNYKSTSCVVGVFSIHKKTDFDVVLDLQLKDLVGYFFWLFKSIYSYDIFHLSFHGGLLRYLSLEVLEPYLYKAAGIKTVLVAYGSDVHVYDKIANKAYAHTLMSFYPQDYAARKEILTQIMRWSKHADVIIPGMLIPNGFPRWDIVTPNFVVIDSSKFAETIPRKKSDKIVIVHTPNHRIIKGSEYIISAVKTLQSEGIPVELILIEGLKNDEVLKILREKADILVEKIIGPSYALSGIEGMAAGLPVVGNISTIDWDKDMNLFYRYSFLSECPILNANPESITDTLRILCSSPKLRNDLGRSGREYVEKYHSFRAAQHLYGKIYEKIWYGEDVDLINLYHPLMSDYVKTNPVKHPLVRNDLPVSYSEK